MANRIPEMYTVGGSRFEFEFNRDSSMVKPKSYVHRLQRIKGDETGEKEIPLTVNVREKCCVDFVFDDGGPKRGSSYTVRIVPSDFEPLFKEIAEKFPNTARIFADCASVASAGQERQLEALRPKRV